MYRWTYSESQEMYYATRHVGMGGQQIDTLKECKRSILDAAAKSDSVRYVRITEYSDENPMGDTVANYNVKRRADRTLYLSTSNKVDMNKSRYLRDITGIRGAF